LVSFNGNNGASPKAALVQRTDGKFYGTTYSGGASGLGTVFSMTPSGTLTTMVSFNDKNGAYPSAALVEGVTVISMARLKMVAGWYRHGFQDNAFRDANHAHFI